MPVSLPVPDDYIGATDDDKILAALNDATEPLVYFQRMYFKTGAIPFPLVSGKKLIGPGMWGGCGITTPVAGDLFASSGGITGFQIEGLQLVGDVAGAALRTTPAAGLAMRHIVVEDCYVQGWHYGAWYASGTVMYSKAIDNKISGNAAASPGAAALYIDRGTTSFEARGNALAGYKTLVRTCCDGMVLRDGTLEACGGDAIYLESGALTVDGPWFDQSTIAGFSINRFSGSGKAEGCRGLTAAKINGSVQFTPMP